MKKRFSFKFFLASTLIAVSGFHPAHALDVAMPAIDRAQQELTVRVQQGLRSGAITPAEGQNAYRGIRQVEQQKNQLKAEGYASPEDRQHLRQQLAEIRSDVEELLARPRQVLPSGADIPGVDERNRAVRASINEALRSGVFSREDARRFERRRVQIERRSIRFKADGVVTADERQQLRDEFDDLRDEIEDAKDDYDAEDDGR